MSQVNFNKKNDFVSLVMIESEMAEGEFDSSIRDVSNLLDKNFIDYEILIVGNSSNVIEIGKLNLILKEVPCLRFIELSYNVDYEIAVTAGLENSIGDYVFIFNPSQDPLDALLPMIDICIIDNVDVVVGVAQNAKNSIGYRLVRPIIGLVLDEIGYQIPKNATTLRCLSRMAVNSATKARNYHHQVFVRISQCGLDTSSFNYNISSAERNKKGLLSSLRTTLNLLVFNSTKPLRWMSILGIFGSFFSLVFATYSFIVRLIYHDVADGWSSTIILVSMMFMLLFIILSFFGEYLGRLLNDQSRHEPYWIINEYHSSVMVELNRQNVISESEKMPSNTAIN